MGKINRKKISFRNEPEMNSMVSSNISPSWHIWRGHTGSVSFWRKILIEIPLKIVMDTRHTWNAFANQIWLHIAVAAIIKNPV